MVDLTEQSRKYTVKYALNAAAGVKSLLRDRHKIGLRRFTGDTAASDILIDLASAINTAGLTERQTEAVALVYGPWDLTQADAATVMGVGQDSVSDFLNGAARRIAAVYERWEYGEIEVIAEEGDGEIDEARV
ncbi:RNA polymerase subunit sigma [Paenibacillus sp. GCM10012307]|uniref:RNA polymerase subunit sigma n=1 Tax=Paenibacillus roseus TaxID=2798579 RepID=A0A934J3N6_9BACL|nr:RNA polymerase subunit sigma [Paenibacillus roseus]MBJ6364171.1 RNA polymerase subunit sigma [Paenibacillus roseus]